MRPESISIMRIVTLAGTNSFEVELASKNYVVRASAPVGTSAGKHEVPSFPGGIELCERNFKAIADELKKFEPNDQVEIDSFLKERIPRIGGTAALAASIAFLRADAAQNGVELFESISSEVSMPRILSNVVGGGAHSLVGPVFQEFLLASPKAKSFKEALEKNLGAYFVLKERLKKSVRGRNLEFALTVDMDTRKVLEHLYDVAKEFELKIGLDVAANEFYNGKAYVYKGRKKRKPLSTQKHIDFLLDLIKEFKIFYVEDPLHDDDFGGFGLLQDSARKCIICGDDLLATNTHRLKKAIGRVRASIVKPNQVGTVTDTLAYIAACQGLGIIPVISHRSQETPDDFISHLAVATSAPLVKIGVNRAAKLNTLLRIEKKETNKI